MKNKGLRVNMGKIKIICGKGLATIKQSGKYPFSVCRKGIVVLKNICWENFLQIIINESTAGFMFGKAP